MERLSKSGDRKMMAVQWLDGGKMLKMYIYVKICVIAWAAMVFVFNRHAVFPSLNNIYTHCIV